MRTRIWHSDWKPRWLIRCVSAALLSFMDKQDIECHHVPLTLKFVVSGMIMVAEPIGPAR